MKDNKIIKEYNELLYILTNLITDGIRKIIDDKNEKAFKVHLILYIPRIGYKLHYIPFINEKQHSFLVTNQSLLHAFVDALKNTENYRKYLLSEEEITQFTYYSLHKKRVTRLLNELIEIPEIKSIFNSDHISELFMKIIRIFNNLDTDKIDRIVGVRHVCALKIFQMLLSSIPQFSGLPSSSMEFKEPIYSLSAKKKINIWKTNSLIDSNNNLPMRLFNLLSLVESCQWRDDNMEGEFGIIPKVYNFINQSKNTIHPLNNLSIYFYSSEQWSLEDEGDQNVCVENVRKVLEPFQTSLEDLVRFLCFDISKDDFNQFSELKNSRILSITHGLLNCFQPEWVRSGVNQKEYVFKYQKWDFPKFNVDDLCNCWGLYHETSKDKIENKKTVKIEGRNYFNDFCLYDFEMHFSKKDNDNFNIENLMPFSSFYVADLINYSNKLSLNSHNNWYHNAFDNYYFYFDFLRQQSLPEFKNIRICKEQKFYENILSKIKNKDINEIKILDVGIGYGRLIKVLEKVGISNSNIWGLDLSTEMCKIAKRIIGNRCKCGDMLDADIIFKDMKFDVIIFAFTTFGYLKNNQNRNVLNKIKKILNFKGLIIIDQYIKPNKDEIKLPIWEQELSYEQRYDIFLQFLHDTQDNIKPLINPKESDKFVKLRKISEFIRPSNEDKDDYCIYKGDYLYYNYNDKLGYILNRRDPYWIHLYSHYWYFKNLGDEFNIEFYLDFETETVYNNQNISKLDNMGFFSKDKEDKLIPRTIICVAEKKMLSDKEFCILKEILHEFIALFAETPFAIKKVKKFEGNCYNKMDDYDISIIVQMYELKDQLRETTKDKNIAKAKKLINRLIDICES